jgi:hypothetical protein
MSEFFSCIIPCLRSGCFVDLLLGVGVVSSLYSVPSALDLSISLGLDRMCCAKVIDASITWEWHAS